MTHARILNTRRLVAALVAAIALTAGAASTASAAATYPTSFEERTMVSGLTMPTAVADVGASLAAMMSGRPRPVFGNRHPSSTARANEHVRLNPHANGS